jgi:hypothetical protein
MSYRVLLFNGDGKTKSPSWWIRYVDSLKPPVMENLKIGLIPYRAKFIYDEETLHRYIEFEEESYYSMLILRYS